jgi:hypothetical protein
VTSESAGLRIRDVGSDIGWCRSRGIPQCWLVVIAVRDADDIDGRVSTPGLQNSAKQASAPISPGRARNRTRDLVQSFVGDLFRYFPEGKNPAFCILTGLVCQNGDETTNTGLNRNEPEVVFEQLRKWPLAPLGELNFRSLAYTTELDSPLTDGR